jgi:hypothetical protein
MILLTEEATSLASKIEDPKWQAWLRRATDRKDERSNLVLYGDIYEPVSDVRYASALSRYPTLLTARGNLVRNVEKMVDTEFYVGVAGQGVGVAHRGEMLERIAALPSIAPEALTYLLTHTEIYRSPQEEWLESLSERIRQAVRGTILTEAAIEMGKWTVDGLAAKWLLRLAAGESALFDGTVREFLQYVMEREGAGDVPLFNPGTYSGDTAWAGSNDMQVIEYVTEEIVRGIKVKLTGMNLLSRALDVVLADETMTVFDEPMITLMQRQSESNVEPALRAKALLLATAQIYGWKRLTIDAHMMGWHKQTYIEEGGRVDGRHEVRIADDGRTFLDDSYRCIVFTGAGGYNVTGLPYGDEIAGRMMTLATTARNEISTLSGEDRHILAAMFKRREVVDSTIADKAESIFENLLASGGKSGRRKREHGTEVSPHPAE